MSLEIKGVTCRNCGSSSLFHSANKDNVVGIYCKDCGKFIKWASKDEKNLIKHYCDKMIDCSNAAKLSLDLDNPDSAYNVVSQIKQEVEKLPDLNKQFGFNCGYIKKADVIDILNRYVAKGGM